MMEKNAKIYVAGHRGMVGSAIVLVIINYIHDVDKQPLCKGNLFPAIFMQILQIWFCFLQTILQDQTFCHISIKSIHIKIILFILLFCLQNLISF